MTEAQEEAYVLQINLMVYLVVRGSHRLAVVLGTGRSTAVPTAHAITGNIESAAKVSWTRWFGIQNRASSR